MDGKILKSQWMLQLLINYIIFHQFSRHIFLMYIGVIKMQNILVYQKME